MGFKSPAPFRLFFAAELGVDEAEPVVPAVVVVASAVVPDTAAVVVVVFVGLSLLVEVCEDDEVPPPAAADTAPFTTCGILLTAFLMSAPFIARRILIAFFIFVSSHTDAPEKRKQKKR
jgi:hypothetical protein